MFDFAQGRKGAYGDAVGIATDSLKFRNMAKVEHELGFEQLLPHGWNKVGPARQDSNVVAVLCEIADRLFELTRAQQFELREAQSSPPAIAAVSRLDGSSSCRIGPFPLNQSDPPCSRKRAGAVGSMPSVRFKDLAFFFARSAASTRSGVNGDSCRRTPTAS